MHYLTHINFGRSPRFSLPGFCLVALLTSSALWGCTHGTKAPTESASHSVEWVEISVFGQCVQELPWKTPENIVNYFKEQKILVKEVRSRSRGMVCEACTCPSYDITEVQVSESDATKLKTWLEANSELLKMEKEQRESSG